jgi:hypothetical protein
MKINLSPKRERDYTPESHTSVSVTASPDSSAFTKRMLGRHRRLTLARIQVPNAVWSRIRDRPDAIDLATCYTAGIVSNRPFVVGNEYLDSRGFADFVSAIPIFSTGGQLAKKRSRVKNPFMHR